MKTKKMHKELVSDEDFLTNSKNLDGRLSGRRRGKVES